MDERLRAEKVGATPTRNEKQTAAARKVAANLAPEKPLRIPEVVRSSDSLIPEADMESFRDAEGYGDQKLRADYRYIEESHKRMEEADPGGAARVLEQFFTVGITAGGWLGNVRQNANGQAEVDFRLAARGTAKYDDYRNKMDVYATLKFAQPIADEDYGVKTKGMVLGFDVTTDGREFRILEKLTKAYNGPGELPFGFSKMDYYQCGDVRKKIPMMPRYLIGLSNADVRTLQETTTFGTGNVTQASLQSGLSLINRFKVLSEIRAENELYQAMLPDDLDSEMLKRANASLYAVDQCLHQALLNCTEDILGAKFLPKEVLDAAKKGNTRSVIEKYLLDQSRRNFAQTAREKGWDTDGSDDTFAQIMDCCRELTAAAYDGRLDALRGVTKHNQAVTREMLGSDAAA